MLAVGLGFGWDLSFSQSARVRRAAEVRLTKRIPDWSCVSCQTTDNNYFTAVHHRETPERIRDGKSDAGIVWKTEVLEAQRHGAAVDAVELPASDSLRDEVSYAVGALDNSKNKAVADRYLAFLASPAGQAAYAAFGFVNASPDELRLKPIE